MVAGPKWPGSTWRRNRRRYGSWIAQQALVMALVWPVLIVAIFLPLTVRRYQRLSR